MNKQLLGLVITLIYLLMSSCSTFEDPKELYACQTDEECLPSYQCTNYLNTSYKYCALVCEDKDYQDCNLDPTDGCETYVVDNPEHCGACGRSIGEHQICQGTELICDNQNYGDCNLDPTDGCETYVVDNPEHCGACGRSIGKHQICQGTEIVCDKGYYNCDGDMNNGCEDPSEVENPCKVCIDLECNDDNSYCDETGCRANVTDFSVADDFLCLLYGGNAVYYVAFNGNEDPILDPNTPDVFFKEISCSGSLNNNEVRIYLSDGIQVYNKAIDTTEGMTIEEKVWTKIDNIEGQVHLLQFQKYSGYWTKSDIYADLDRVLLSISNITKPTEEIIKACVGEDFLIVAREEDAYIVFDLFGKVGTVISSEWKNLLGIDMKVKKESLNAVYCGYEYIIYKQFNEEMTSLTIANTQKKTLSFWINNENNSCEDEDYLNELNLCDILNNIRSIATDVDLIYYLTDEHKVYIQSLTLTGENVNSPTVGELKEIASDVMRIRSGQGKLFGIVNGENSGIYMWNSSDFNNAPQKIMDLQIELQVQE